MKIRGVVGSFILFLMILVVLIIFFSNKNITGYGTYTFTDVSNCNQEQINNLWTEIYSDNGNGITIINETNIYCDNFIAYKVSGNNILGFIKGNDSENNTIRAYYINSSSPSLVELGLSGKDYSQLALELNNIYTSAPSLGVEFVNITENGAKILYDNQFDKVNTSAFVLLSGLYRAKGGSAGEYWEASVDDEYDIRRFDYKFLSSISATFSGNIPNFTFERNSTNNYAFDLSDYFIYTETDIISFTYFGNNTNGEYINISVVNGDVKFTPKFNFTGSREFDITFNFGVPGAVTSNKFKINIVENVNDAPILIKDIEPLTIIRGKNVTLDLRDYFNDPDDNTLNYYIVGNGSNIDVSFNSYSMIVKLKDNFSVSDEFRVRANDGEFNRTSNRILVFEGSVVLLPSSNNSLDENNSEDGNSTLLTEGSNNDPVESGSFFNNLISNKWAWIGLGVVFLLGIIGFIAHLIVSKPNGSGSVPGGLDPVNEYLKNLEGSGGWQVQMPDGVDSVNPNQDVVGSSVPPETSNKFVRRRRGWMNDRSY